MRFGLIVLALVLCSWASPAWAKITFGVVPDSEVLFHSVPQAQKFAAYLEKRLGEEVGIKEFQNTADLHAWLNRFRMVDMAVFSVDYVRRQPVGEFEVLATVVPVGILPTSASELVVARQGIRRGLRNRLEMVLTAMESDPEGQQLLSEAGIVRLVGAKISLPVDLSAAVPSTADVSDSNPTADLQDLQVVAKVVALPGAPPAPAERLNSSPTRLANAPVVPAAPESIPPEVTEPPVPSRGGGDLISNLPVKLEADEMVYDKGTSTYRAQGRVRLLKGGVALSAEELVFDESTSAVLARGDVHLTDKLGEVRAEQIDYTLDSGLGRLTSGALLVTEHNFHLAGAEIEKIGVNSYQIEEGAFTTCDGEVPSWKFGAKHIDVDLGGYARANHVLFYLHDIPVFYFPYLAFPVKTERESGLLIPRFGYSKKRGFELSQAFYQVIDRNQDLTFYFDYLTAFGSGEGLEYRYIFGADNEGMLKGYYVNNVRNDYLQDRIKEDPSLAETLDGSERYALEWNHFGTLGNDWVLSADVEYVSHRDYLDEFGVDAGEYNKDQTESEVFLSRTWQNSVFVGDISYTRDLEVDDDTTLQRLPEIRYDALRQRLGETPFFINMGTSYTYFWRKEEADEKVKGQRLHVRPALSAFFTPLDWLEVVPEIGFQERIYQTSDAGAGYEQNGMFDFSTRIGTSFSRIYDGSLGPYQKFRHSIDPEILYVYRPNEDQDHLPSFDSLDRIVPENRIEYALINRVMTRIESELGAPEYLEVMYLRLAQSFDIRQARHDREDDSDTSPFSEFRGELVLAPTRSTVIDLDARYDTQDRTLQAFNARSGLLDRAGNSLSFDYRYVRDSNEYVAGNLAVAWLAPVYLGYEHRYDFSDRRALEKILNVEYRAQCWSVFLTLRDRLEDQEYMVTFALAGLGNVFNLGGSMSGRGETP